MVVDLGIGASDDSDAGSLWLEGTSTSLVEALSDGLVVADEGGQILYANRRLEGLLGWSPSSLVGQPVTMLVPERLRSAHLQAFGAFIAGGPPRIIGNPIRVHALTAAGTETPVDIVLSVIRRDCNRWLMATIRAATPRYGLEQHSEVVERLLGVLADGRGDLGLRFVEVVGESLGWDAAALWAVEDDGATGAAGADDADGATLRVRHFWHRAGIDVSEFRAATESRVLTRGAGLPGRSLHAEAPIWVDDVQVDPNFRRAAAARAVGLRSGFAFPLRRGDRIVGIIELFATQVREPDGALLAAMGVLGYRLGELLTQAEDERERRRLQQEQQRLLRVQEFLLRAVRVLADAADYNETLERLAAVAVPDLADLCLIDVLAEDGSLVRMVSHHADPAVQHLAAELRNYPPDPNGNHPSVAVLRARRSRASLHMSEQFMATTTRSQRHLELLHQLRFTSYVCVPLVAEDRALGTLTLVSAGSGRRFGEADLALAEELAGQAAAVIDRARRHDREREAAHQLQRSLLPGRLPDLPGIEIAVNYIPGTEGADVGGDWYDVIQLDNGAVGLAIGDVAGHDMGAAALMGQLRNATRAYAIRDGINPAAVLDELRRFSDILEIERIATAAYARFSPLTGAFRVASAGHPPPLILRAAGEVEVMDLVPSPPIGLRSALSEESSVVLGIGDIVVMFTDGLVERRGAGIDEGMDLLAQTMVSAKGHSTAELCAQIVAEVVPDGSRQDDIAILVVRRVGP
jgi:PAS domain S-box-containing protein